MKNEITGDTLASKIGDKTAYQNYCESWDRIWGKEKVEEISFGENITTTVVDGVITQIIITH